MHGKYLSYYQFGRTSLFASQYDQRFSYCLYVPESYAEDGDRVYPLAVLIHGTGRNAQGYRDAFADFCEQHQCIALAPLFPCGICQPGELNSYKFIRHHDIRFDQVLLGMVAEIAGIYRVDTRRFLMFGFSGGGHFTHRFFYLHPERLLGISIGAPGMVTLLDTDHDWWVGVRDIEQQFGRPLDLAAMRDVSVQMVIGGDDTDTWEIAVRPSDERWMPGADLQGANRLDRMESLKRSFQQAGIEVRHDIVPGIGHESYRVLDPVKDFFGQVLTSRWQAPAASELTTVAGRA